MTLYRVLAILAMAISIWACKKNEPKPLPKEDFSCVKLVDEVGQDMGIYGCVSSSDWQNSTLSTEESAYFSSIDTSFLLHGTSNVPITGVALYPIPVVQGGVFAFHLLSPSPGNPVKFQMVIIDESKNVLFQTALQIDCNGTIHVQAPATTFDKGAFYRVYYRVSALGAPVLFEGHGNIVVCKQPGMFNIDTECI